MLSDIKDIHKLSGLDVLLKAPITCLDLSARFITIFYYYTFIFNFIFLTNIQLVFFLPNLFIFIMRFTNISSWAGTSQSFSTHDINKLIVSDCRYTFTWTPPSHVNFSTPLPPQFSTPLILLKKGPSGIEYNRRYNLERYRPWCIFFSISEIASTSATPVPTTSSTKATEIWDKAIDLATPLGVYGPRRSRGP